MIKKRKSENCGMDDLDIDRTMFQNFSSAANSLSQLYSLSQAQQKLAFQAGEQHGLEKLRQWIEGSQGEGSRVTGPDVVAYLQHELDCGGEDTAIAPTSHFQQSADPNAHMFVPTSIVPVPCGEDQAKLYVFPSAQPYPVRGRLPQESTQHYHVTQEWSSPDSAMDMNTEGHPHW